MNMTSRERMLAALNHRKPDRTPVFEYVLLSPVADALLGRRYSADPVHWAALERELGWAAAVRQMAADRVELACRLEHDLIYAWPNPRPRREPPPAPAPPPAPDPAPDPVANMVRRNEAAAGWSPGPASESLFIYECLRTEMARRHVDLLLLAPAYSHGVWTDTDLMQTMVLAPEVAHRHFALATCRALASIEAYRRLGIELYGVGGDFAGTRPLISPAAYHAFIMPEVRACSRRVHELGGWAVNASDGNLWTVIDDFLLGCEVDGYLEIDLHATMDLRRLKARFGERITFFGNLDCGNILSFGNAETVRCHTWECLEAGLGAGGHVLCASNAIIASVSVANYLAVVAAYRDFFKLPPLTLS